MPFEKSAKKIAKKPNSMTPKAKKPRRPSNIRTNMDVKLVFGADSELKQWSDVEPKLFMTPNLPSPTVSLTMPRVTLLI